jgi:hypothetical protein
VADAEPPAGERVDDAAVTAAVVGQYAFDNHAVATVESERALQEGDGRGRAFVCEDLGVGETAVVVDGDMDVLPAGPAVSRRR